MAFCVFSASRLWRLGVILTVIGLISWASSWGKIGAARYYWAAFLGLPIIAVGSALMGLRNLGPTSRRLSGEMVLVARNDVNGLNQVTVEDNVVTCNRCQATNSARARFCNQCGTALNASTCPGCGAEHTPDARFCSQCGKSLE